MAEAIERLGLPSNESFQFYWSQRGGYDAEYAAAAASDSTIYLVWVTGSTVFCTAGFDENDRLTVHFCGGA